MSATPIPGTRYIGHSIGRIEDERILKGQGRYVGDHELPNTAHAFFVRSPFAHAAVTAIDVEAARAAPGVVAVLTAADIPVSIQVGADIPGFHAPVFGALSGERVRHVGDPVALVLADSRAAAEDAAELVDVDYEPLDPVPSIDEALDPARPPLFADTPDNVWFREERDFGDVSALDAKRIVRLTLHPQRVAVVPMEGRAGLADYDPGTGQLTYTAGVQAPHAVRFTLSNVLGLPPDRVRVIAPDVGGAFGQKALTAREDIAVCAASRALGRPVKWIEDRAENLVAAMHARDERMEIAAAVDDDGTILAFDVDVIFNQGSYPLITFPSALFGAPIRAHLPSSTRARGVRWHYTAVATSTTTSGSYRGPWAVETLGRELLMEQIARELQLDVVDVRRRNLVGLDEQPWKMASGPTLDLVRSRDTLDRAAELAYAGFRERQRGAREEGRLLGIGFSTYIEAAPGPPDWFEALGFSMGGERAHARLEPDGRLTLITAQAPHGQGHETTLAQVAATELGVPIEHVRVLHGDTSFTPFSMVGTGGSRAATIASGAAMHATREVKRKVLALAGSMLEIAPEDLEIVDGTVMPKGDPSAGMPLAQVAMASLFSNDAELEADLRSSAYYAGDVRGGFSGGTHVCTVEVDPETGQVAVEDYLVVEDCGPLINPAIVDGQIRGGVAQGIGLALLEHAAYDEEGQFLSGTFMDYLVPTAMEIPSIRIEHLHGEATDDETPWRGVGEGGVIAAPPAVVNAVADALGVTIDRLPLTPERVLGLLDARGAEEGRG